MTYKFSLVSDLHVDFPQPKTPPLEQNVIVAGDTGNGLIGLKFLNKLKRKGHNVFAVDGNHEHYSNFSTERTVEETTAAFYQGLDQRCVQLVAENLWVIGRNGWYPVEDEDAWRSYMNDSKRADLSASEARMWATHDAIFIDNELSKLPRDRRAIVVTHTAPCLDTLNPEYEGHYSNDWYWNPKLLDVLRKHKDVIAVWCHGHTHAPADKIVDGVRVVCNPRGYPGENPTWAPMTISI